MGNMGFFNTVLDLGIYSIVGMILMMVGYFIIDLLIPVDFPKEIKEGNKAVGWLSAGIYIGLGIIIRTAVQSFTDSGVALSTLFGIIDTVFYAVSGIVFFLLAYVLIDLVNRRYHFNEELKSKNEALGIMVFGIFVGVALIISGVIH